MQNRASTESPATPAQAPVTAPRLDEGRNYPSIRGHRRGLSGEFVDPFGGPVAKGRFHQAKTDHGPFPGESARRADDAQNGSRQSPPADARSREAVLTALPDAVETFLTNRPASAPPKEGEIVLHVLEGIPELDLSQLSQNERLALAFQTTGIVQGARSKTKGIDALKLLPVLAALKGKVIGKIFDAVEAELAQKQMAEPIDVIGLFDPHSYRSGFDQMAPTLERIAAVAQSQSRPMVLLIEEDQSPEQVLRGLAEIANTNPSKLSQTKELILKGSREIRDHWQEHGRYIQELAQRRDIMGPGDKSTPPKQYRQGLQSFIGAHPEVHIVVEKPPFEGWLAAAQGHLRNFEAQLSAQKGFTDDYQQAVERRAALVAKSWKLRDDQIVERQLGQIAQQYPDPIIVILRGDGHQHMFDDLTAARRLIAVAIARGPDTMEPVEFIAYRLLQEPEQTLSPAEKTYLAAEWEYTVAGAQLDQDRTVRDVDGLLGRLRSVILRVVSSDVLEQLRHEFPLVMPRIGVYEVGQTSPTTAALDTRNSSGGLWLWLRDWLVTKAEISEKDYRQWAWAIEGLASLALGAIGFLRAYGRTGDPTFAVSLFILTSAVAFLAGHLMDFVLSRRHKTRVLAGNTTSAVAILLLTYGWTRTLHGEMDLGSLALYSSLLLLVHLLWNWAFDPSGRLIQFFRDRTWAWRSPLDERTAALALDEFEYVLKEQFPEIESSERTLLANEILARSKVVSPQSEIMMNLPRTLQVCLFVSTFPLVIPFEIFLPGAPAEQPPILFSLFLAMVLPLTFLMFSLIHSSRLDLYIAGVRRPTDDDPRVMMFFTPKSLQQPEWQIRADIDHEMQHFLKDYRKDKGSPLIQSDVTASAAQILRLAELFSERFPDLPLLSDALFRDVFSSLTAGPNDIKEGYEAARYALANPQASDRLQKIRMAGMQRHKDIRAGREENYSLSNRLGGIALALREHYGNSQQARRYFRELNRRKSAVEAFCAVEGLPSEPGSPPAAAPRAERSFPIDRNSLSMAFFGLNEIPAVVGYFFTPIAQSLKRGIRWLIEGVRWMVGAPFKSFLWRGSSERDPDCPIQNSVSDLVSWETVKEEFLSSVNVNVTPDIALALRQFFYESQSLTTVFRSVMPQNRRLAAALLVSLELGGRVDIRWGVDRKLFEFLYRSGQIRPPSLRRRAKYEYDQLLKSTEPPRRSRFRLIKGLSTKTGEPAKGPMKYAISLLRAA